MSYTTKIGNSPEFQVQNSSGIHEPEDKLRLKQDLLNLGKRPDA
jgi:hypothetical protein